MSDEYCSCMFVVDTMNVLYHINDFHESFPMANLALGERIDGTIVPDNIVMRDLSQSDNWRAKLMELLPLFFHCSIHQKNIEARYCLAVSVLGEFSRSVKEIDRSFWAIKKSIGSLPLPNPSPNDHYCRFEESRRRLVQGDAEFLTVIVTAITKLFSKFSEHMSHLPKMQSIVSVKRTETLRLLVSLWMLPEPMVFGAPPIHEGIKKHMISLCQQDGDLYRILISSISSPRNLVSLLSTKLEEYEQEFANKRSKWARDYWVACINGEVLDDDDIIELGEVLDDDDTYLNN
ncbi:hypothetical protein ISN44_As13g026600 [Arabidopsis suecica]|uniref:Uncharacterized protein n=1 Tax=Arabidopsis suecica TaxID=45249 RepID=A0A8T1XWE1_ARASU|nr:hypothetical protein ISN44_As13g026600 [Arabidopsis suecica]